MTKPKAIPQWGKRLSGLVRHPIFSEKVVAKLAHKIGCRDQTRIGELRDLLNDRASVYWSFRHHDAGPSPREIRAALQDIHHRAAELHDHLQRLDDRARTALWSAYTPSIRPFDYEEDWADGQIMAGRDCDHVNRLAVASDIAARETSAGAGRPSVKTLTNLASAAARIFESFSGTQFSIGKRTESEKRGAAWVREVIQLVDPEVAEANATTALRGALSRVKKRRAQK
jgi:hypothetical protein